MKETYIGPASLEEALAQAEERQGLRLALSVPNGSYLAIEIDGQLSIREVAILSGQAGSVVGTGRWVEKCPASVSWRPA